ncbi:hypothetical protein GF325_08850 [Candidatus Bathyarchaeota archaeon]|nr:hypothetical protein [Candidatus Bathyarchaeota archaeon]
MMQSRKPVIMLYGFLVLSTLVVTVEPVSAYIEVKRPHSMIISTGTANTSMLEILDPEQDDLSMKINSNRSGDKNFHESAMISSKADLEDYFNIYRSHYKLPYSVEDEKLSGDDIIHKDVIRFQDKFSNENNSGYYYYNQWAWLNEPIHASSLEDEGYVEFYFLSEASNGTFLTVYGDDDYRKDPLDYNNESAAFGMHFGITPFGGDSNSSFFCGTDWSDDLTKIDSVEYEPNRWYHVQLSFDYNSSWNVKIDNATVYTSSGWNIDEQLTKFDYLGFCTQTWKNFSGHQTHVYYLDAIGLSYDMSAHNQNTEGVEFNEAYEDYIDKYSVNNINDGDLNASLAVYFKFNLEDYPNKVDTFSLIIKGHFFHVVDTGYVKMFNREYLVYDHTDLSYKPYVPGFSEEYLFSASDSEKINSSVYIDGEGKFALKIEAASGTNFDYIVDSMYFRFDTGMGGSYVFIFVIVAFVFTMAVFLTKIAKKGQLSSPRKKRSGRNARSID